MANNEEFYTMSKILELIQSLNISTKIKNLYFQKNMLIETSKYVKQISFSCRVQCPI